MPIIKKRGFTIVELLVSLSFITIIILFLFQIILLVKDVFSSDGLRTEMMTKQALLSRKLNDSLLENKLINVTKCGNNCLGFVFYNGTVNNLRVDKNTNTFSYGNYKMTLVEGSSFGDINIDVMLESVTGNPKNNAMLYILIPILHKNFENEDFGVNVVYQYNIYDTKITSVMFDETNNSYGYLMLKGESTVFVLGDTYNDPGYVVYDANGNIVSNPTNVMVDNAIIPNVKYEDGIYVVTYSLMDANGASVYSTERTVEFKSPI